MRLSIRGGDEGEERDISYGVYDLDKSSSSSGILAWWTATKIEGHYVLKEDFVSPAQSRIRGVICPVGKDEEKTRDLADRRTYELADQFAGDDLVEDLTKYSPQEQPDRKG